MLSWWSSALLENSSTAMSKVLIARTDLKCAVCILAMMATLLMKHLGVDFTLLGNNHDHVVWFAEAFVAEWLLSNNTSFPDFKLPPRPRGNCVNNLIN